MLQDQFPKDLYFTGVNYRAHRYFGSHVLDDGRWLFRVWAPHAKWVSLVGDFCGWDIFAFPLTKTDDRGVWAVTDPQEIQGDVAKLVFRVKSGAKAENANFGVVLEIQDGAGALNRFQASADVESACDHAFGAWQDRGEQGHSRSCTKCKTIQNGPHNWDSGVIQDGPDGGRIKVTSCRQCPAKKTEVLEEGNGQATEAPEETRPQPTIPTRPPETEPKPTEPPRPTQPTKPVEPEEPARPTEPPVVTEPGPVIPMDPKPTEPAKPVEPKPTEQNPTQPPQVIPGPTEGIEEPSETPESESTEPKQTDPHREAAPTAPPMVIRAVGTRPPETTAPVEETPETTVGEPEPMPEGTKIPTGLIVSAALLILAAAGVGLTISLRKRK